MSPSVLQWRMFILQRWALYTSFILAFSTEASLLLFHYNPNSNPQELPNPTVGGDIPMSVLPPNMPMRFYNEFELYYTPQDDPAVPLPPWPKLHPPDLPYAIGRGQTWYAADLGIMIESYTDYCVPIFEPNSYFPCVLFNYNGTAYFISDVNTGYGPCCVYRRPWAPPHRDFMQQFTRYYNGSTNNFGEGILHQPIDWWIIPQQSKRVNANGHVVFGGYGWSGRVLKSGYRPQVCFWYEGNVGWAQQLFYNFVDTGPRTKELEHFQLPEVCHTDRACLYRP